jgi:hypothetical protein
MPCGGELRPFSGVADSATGQGTESARRWVGEGAKLSPDDGEGAKLSPDDGEGAKLSPDDGECEVVL